MKKFDEIKGLAAGNFGLITAAQARELGVTRSCLSRWVKMDWLEHSARGVYRVSDFPPSRFDSFAALTEEFGPEARVVGESVLGMLELTSTNPRRMHVGVPRRARHNHSSGIVVTEVSVDEPVECYEGVRSQSVCDAIMSCRGKIVPSRLLEAAKNGHSNGYLTDAEYRMLKREVGK